MQKKLTYLNKPNSNSLLLSIHRIQNEFFFTIDVNLKFLINLLQPYFQKDIPKKIKLQKY
jgi:hypothetical protein